jgi:hypothetical protein
MSQAAKHDPAQSPPGVILTQLPDQPPAFLRMWWSLPNWSRLLPVFGGALLAPMVLLPVSAPPASDFAPDIAFAPMSPVEPVSPTAPPTPVGLVIPAGQASPIAPGTTASTAPASHTAGPSPSATTTTRSQEAIDTTPAGSTTMTPLPAPQAPTADLQPHHNDTPGMSTQSGLSSPSPEKSSPRLTGGLGVREVMGEDSLGGSNA